MSWSVIGMMGSQCSPIHEDTYASAVSSHQRMLLLIIGQTRTGKICPHPSKISLPSVNHKTCGMLTWAITIWPIITLRDTSIATMLSTTMLELLWMSPPRNRPPHQPPCVLASLYHTHLPNQTFRRRRLTYLKTQLGTLRLALLKPSLMNRSI